MHGCVSPTQIYPPPTHCNLGGSLLGISIWTKPSTAVPVRLTFEMFRRTNFSTFFRIERMLVDMDMMQQQQGRSKGFSSGQARKWVCGVQKKLPQLWIENEQSS